jgi:DNA-binding transcriptional ArsR family regulator
MGLTPTLWRTCRVLAGPTRLELLRRIVAKPDACVAELMAAVGISEPRASQELRRLQARGLVQAVRTGRWMCYRPVSDPKVSSAKPLLAAMKAALARRSPEAEAQTIRVAKAFAHERRLKLVCALRRGPCTAGELQFTTSMPGAALARHLAVMKAGGVVRRSGKAWELAPHAHPLAKTMAGLLGKT